MFTGSEIRRKFLEGTAHGGLVLRTAHHDQASIAEPVAAANWFIKRDDL